MSRRPRRHVVPRALPLALPGVIAMGLTWLFTRSPGIGFAALLAVTSAVSAVVYTLDKRRAERDAFRVPEGTLLGLAWLGGGLGALVAMLALRHKTRVTRFVVGVPFAAGVQIAAAVAVGALAR